MHHRLLSVVLVMLLMVVMLLKLVMLLMLTKGNFSEIRTTRQYVKSKYDFYYSLPFALLLPFKHMTPF